MDQETTKSMAQSLGEPGMKAFVVGREVVFPPMQVGEKAFHFNHGQVMFLYALQKTGGDVEKSVKACGRDVEWATKFLASAKFRAFRAAKLAAMSVRNGDLVEWWWKFGLDGAKGSREFYVGVCHLCHEKNVFESSEAEMMRGDDMGFDARCRVCSQSVELERQKEDVKPTREQVQFWSELGNRLSPKIERVQHTFTNEQFIFEAEAQ